MNLKLKTIMKLLYSSGLFICDFYNVNIQSENASITLLKLNDNYLYAPVKKT